MASNTGPRISTLAQMRYVLVSHESGTDAITRDNDPVERSKRPKVKLLSNKPIISANRPTEPIISSSANISVNRQIASERSAAQQQSAAYSKEVQMDRSAIKQAGGSGGSRLSSLRESTNGIETQVSVMNKNVERYAALESQTDV